MRLILCLVALLAALPARAEPRIVTDIAPVHSLVAAVMGEVGQPTLLLDAAADPHHMSLRPSQARALAKADAIFWIGPALTPWLEKPVTALSDAGRSVALADLPGTHLIELTEAHDGHPQIDPHIWLDPDNAVLWLASIAETLGKIDPQNAATYTANAGTAAEELQALTEDITSQLAPLKNTRYLVAHDAYGYFADRFGLDLTEAVTDSDATAPSAARLAELQDSIESAPVACAFLEPGQNPAALDMLLAGTGTPRAALDALGTDLSPGAALYLDLLRAMADTIATCAD